MRQAFAAVLLLGSIVSISLVDAKPPAKSPRRVDARSMAQPGHGWYCFDRAEGSSVCTRFRVECETYRANDLRQDPSRSVTACKQQKKAAGFTTYSMIHDRHVVLFASTMKSCKLIRSSLLRDFPDDYAKTTACAFVGDKAGDAAPILLAQHVRSWLRDGDRSYCYDFSAADGKSSTCVMSEDGCEKLRKDAASDYAVSDACVATTVLFATSVGGGDSLNFSSSEADCVALAEATDHANCVEIDLAVRR